DQRPEPEHVVGGEEGDRPAHEVLKRRLVEEIEAALERDQARRVADGLMRVADRRAANGQVGGGDRCPQEQRRQDEARRPHEAGGGPGGGAAAWERRPSCDGRREEWEGRKEPHDYAASGSRRSAVSCRFVKKSTRRGASVSRQSWHRGEPALASVRAIGPPQAGQMNGCEVSGGTVPPMAGWPPLG